MGLNYRYHVLASKVIPDQNTLRNPVERSRDKRPHPLSGNQHSHPCIFPWCVVIGNPTTLSTVRLPKYFSYSPPPYIFSSNALACNLWTEGLDQQIAAILTTEINLILLNDCTLNLVYINYHSKWNRIIAVSCTPVTSQVPMFRQRMLSVNK